MLLRLSQQIVCIGIDEGPIFIKKVWDCSHMVIAAILEVLVHMTFELTMVFEFLMFIWIEFHSFAPDTEAAFCPTAILR